MLVCSNWKQTSSTDHVLITVYTAVRYTPGCCSFDEGPAKKQKATFPVDYRISYEGGMTEKDHRYSREFQMIKQSSSEVAEDEGTHVLFLSF